MQKAKAQHEAEMARTDFEARQREQREASEQDVRLEQQRQETELKHLSAMQGAIGASAQDVMQLMVAREQGPPARLIQVVGDVKPIVSLGAGGDAAVEAAEAAHAVSPTRGRLALRRATSAERRRGAEAAA